MVMEFANQLDRQLEEYALALQNQAKAMLATLAEFEGQVKARLDAAEARMAAIHDDTPAAPPHPALRRPVGDP